MPPLPRRQPFAAAARRPRAAVPFARAAALALALLGATPGDGRAQPRDLTLADSLLVRAILDAEDRRDGGARALAMARRHGDPRVRALAARATARIADPAFAARDTLSTPAPPRAPAWREPAWKTRYRAVARRGDPCADSRRSTVAAALRDTNRAVRLLALDRLTPACAEIRGLVDSLVGWIDALPSDAQWADTGRTRWHRAAHALVALVALAPDSARVRLDRLLRHPQGNVRQYAVRAAERLGDTTALRTALDAATRALRATGDRRAAAADANVAALAVTALAARTDRAHTTRFVRLLGPPHAPPALAAARALEGSDDPRVAAAAAAAFEAWGARDDASTHDVRRALLALAGRPASDDRPPRGRAPVTLDAVRLALGADVVLRVTRDPAHGGGTFDVRLRGDVAPILAARILALVRAGWYDGSTWHRVEADFVVQGGSPAANEYVGFHRFLRDELSRLPHHRGTVGLSTRGHDTGDAQWFVNLRDNRRLDADYTLFGEVVAGMAVVDDLVEGDRILHVRVAREP